MTRASSTQTQTNRRVLFNHATMRFIWKNGRLTVCSRHWANCLDCFFNSNCQYESKKARQRVHVHCVYNLIIIYWNTIWFLNCFDTRCQPLPRQEWSSYWTKTICVRQWTLTVTFEQAVKSRLHASQTAICQLAHLTAPIKLDKWDWCWLLWPSQKIDPQ